MLKEDMKRIMLGITYALLLFFLIFRLNDILSVIGGFFNVLFPFILGACLAFILSIPMNFFERILFNNRPIKMKRALCLFLTLLVFVGVVFFVIFLVGPEIFATIEKIGVTIPPFIERVQEWVVSLEIDWKLLQDYINSAEIDWQGLSSNVVDFAQLFLEGFFTSALSMIFSVFKSLLNIVLGLIFAGYLLVSKEKIGGQTKKLLKAFLPERIVKRIIEIASLSHKTFRGFLTGQCFEALVLGTLFFIVMLIIKLPYVLLISVLIAVTALIPIFGAFIGCFVGAFLIIMVDPVKALIFIIVFLVLQQIEGNFIYPKVVGNSVGLPSIWVFVSVTLGGSLFGIAGMVLFIPIVSVIYSVLRENVNKRLQQSKNNEKKKNTKKLE